MDKAHKRTLILNAVLSYFLAAGLTDFFVGGTIADQENDNPFFYLGMAGYLLALVVVGYAFYSKTEFWRTFAIIACWTFPIIGLAIGFIISLATDIL